MQSMLHRSQVISQTEKCINWTCVIQATKFFLKINKVCVHNVTKNWPFKEFPGNPVVKDLVLSLLWLRSLLWHGFYPSLAQKILHATGVAKRGRQEGRERKKEGKEGRKANLFQRTNRSGTTFRSHTLLMNMSLLSFSMNPAQTSLRLIWATLFSLSWGNPITQNSPFTHHQQQISWTAFPGPTALKETRLLCWSSVCLSVTWDSSHPMYL